MSLLKKISQLKKKITPSLLKQKSCQLKKKKEKEKQRPNQSDSIMPK